ncbi:GNAT family N-acetyltransferase [Micromonospora sp. CPCC 205711]|uniref:GNAT family N-acetyltransferase n=1 Tax=Micromonospora sp. CPCC 205547 TaxID=3122400 RepID=UPI002FF42CBA
MSETTPQVDLGAALRALRRAADLSQRELAERSGVPQPTIARIESGAVTDPRFRTVERLVRAASGRITLGEPDASPPPIPHEELRDAAGRHCPAHLDAREVREPRDWPGAWWAHWYDLPPERWNVTLPATTYALDRAARDRRRWGEQIRRDVRVRRCVDDLPATSWRFVAELPDGALVGELRAHERSVEFFRRYPLGDRRELVLDGVLVSAEHRGLGIGRRLLDALATEMDRAGIGAVQAIAEFGGIGFLLACGYRLEASRPASLRLDRPAVSAGLDRPTVSAGLDRPAVSAGSGRRRSGR